MRLTNDTSEQYIEAQSVGKMDDFDSMLEATTVHSQEAKYDSEAESTGDVSVVDFDEDIIESNQGEDAAYSFLEQSENENDSSMNPVEGDTSSTGENSSFPNFDSDVFDQEPEGNYQPTSYPNDGNSSDNQSTQFEGVQTVDDMEQAMAEVEEILRENPAFLMGLLSSSDYNTFVNTIKEYYSEQLSVLEKILAHAEKIYERIADYPVEWDDYNRTLQYYQDEINSAIVKAIERYREEDAEFASMSYEEQVEYVREHDEGVQEAINTRNRFLESFNEKVANEYGDIGITTVEDFYDAYQNLSTLSKQIKEIKQAISTLEQMRDSAPYDLLIYLSDYENFEYDDEVSEEDALTVVDEDFIPIVADKDHPSHDRILEESRDGLTFLFDGNYTKYHEQHPDVTPLEYLKMLMLYDPYGYNLYNIEGIDFETLEALKAIILMEAYGVDLGKKYTYIFQTQGADAANEFLKAVQYQINDYVGQIRAKEFLDSLYESGDGSNALEAILNALGISVQGLVDGTMTFNEGLAYAVESLLTLLGEHAENRMMTSEEYKRMYILMALMPEADRQKYGKILVGKDGEKYSSSSIVDFTKNYSGILLPFFYEFNQGIGNMLPYMLLGAINPYAGLAALGVSAGGNAYHSAMVDGKSLVQALFYELFTGISEPLTEALLGGLPFLSNTKVSSWKAFFKAMVREGTQEALQGAMDFLYRALFMDESLPDIDDVDAWLEVFLNIGKQGLYGALTAGVFNFPHLVIAIHNQHRVNIFIKENEITTEQQRRAIDLIRESDPNLKNLTDNEIKALFPNEFEAMVLLEDDSKLISFLKLIQAMIPADERGEYNIDLLIEQLLSGDVDPVLLDFIRSKLPEFFVRGSQMFEALYKLIPLDDYDPKVPFDQFLLHKLKEGDFSDLNRFSEMFEFLTLLNKKIGNSLFQFEDIIFRKLRDSREWLPEDVQEKIPKYQEIYDEFIKDGGKMFIDSDGSVIDSLAELQELIQNSTGEDAERYQFMYQLMEYYNLIFHQDGSMHTIYDEVYVSRLSRLLELQNRLEELQSLDTLTAEEQSELEQIQKEMTKLFSYVHESDINTVREKHERIEWFKAEQKRLTKELMVKYREYIMNKFSDATPEEKALVEEFLDYWFSDEAIDQSKRTHVLDIANLLFGMRDYSSFFEFIGRFKNALRTVVGIADATLMFEQSEDQSLFALLDIIRRELMKVDTDEDHGKVNDKYRERNLHSHGDQFFNHTPDYQDVPARMQELSEDFNRILQITDPEEFIREVGYLWYQFMLIHPYDDGNGRTGRYLLNILFQHMGIHSEALYASEAERDQFLLALDKYYFQKPPDIEGLKNEFLRIVRESGYYVEK